ncbi:MAG: serine/threonine protein kinase [Candidatus Riflebacteria bacterium]|nr:serine/threonine protein kinase [Candidatus Riflebacteria bacterium]
MREITRAGKLVAVPTLAAALALCGDRDGLTGPGRGRLLPAKMEPELPPRCLAQFSPIRLLATGGFGAVVLARHRTLDAEVAIKVLRATALSGSQLVERFRLEARIVASMSHPHIVKVLDADVENDVPWIAYEYLQGPSLREKLKRGALGVPAAIEAARQVAEALAEAHGRGILHRDVKPDNVLEATAGSYKLADFGAAKWTGATEVHTETGAILGTPNYLAPEVIRGEQPGVWVDIYALGVMLFELATGTLPFRPESMKEVLLWHLEKLPPRVSSLVADASPGFDAVVARALEKGPGDRFQTVREFADDLAALLPLEGGKRVRTARLSGTSSAPSLSDTVLVARPGSAAPVRGRLPFVALGVAMLVLVLAALWGISPRPGRGPAAPPSVRPSGSALLAVPPDGVRLPELLDRATALSGEVVTFVESVKKLRDSALTVAFGRDVLAHHRKRVEEAWQRQGELLTDYLRLVRRAATCPEAGSVWFDLEDCGFELIMWAGELSRLVELGNTVLGRTPRFAGSTVDRMLASLEKEFETAGTDRYRQTARASLRPVLRHRRWGRRVSGPIIVASRGDAACVVQQLIADREGRATIEELTALARFFLRTALEWGEMRKASKPHSAEYRTARTNEWAARMELVALVGRHRGALLGALDDSPGHFQLRASLILGCARLSEDGEAEKHDRLGGLREALAVSGTVSASAVARQPCDWIAYMLMAGGQLRSAVENLDARSEAPELRRFEEMLARARAECSRRGSLRPPSSSPALR